MSPSTRKLAIAAVIALGLVTARAREAEALPLCKFKVVMTIGTVTDMGFKAYDVYTKCKKAGNLDCWKAVLTAGFSLIGTAAAIIDTYCSCGGTGAICVIAGLAPAGGGNVPPGPQLILPDRRIWLP